MYVRFFSLIFKFEMSTPRIILGSTPMAKSV